MTGLPPEGSSAKSCSLWDAEPIRRVLVVLALAGVLTPAAASAQQTSPCPELSRAACSNVAVPLDRSGAVPGTVNLAVARVPATQGPSRGTIVFLAGGPGQSALGSLPDLAAVFRKFAPGYDLLTFDQRGIGRSSPLECSALRGSGSVVGVFAKCGRQLGPGRGLYRTADSVDDLEAVRQAAGAPKVALFGISYGARLAGEYVRRYPTAVSAMVLDSPSTLAGTDPFFLASQRALPGFLGSICGRGACRSFTRSPYTDLARLAAKLRKRSLATSIVNPGGRPTKVRLTASDLFGLVFMSDTDALARAQLPAAISSGRHGDGAPLARLLLRAIGGVSGAQTEEGGVSDVVFAATSCNEAPLPWNAASAPGPGRERAVDIEARKLGPRSFRPFGTETTVSNSPLLAQCLRWPSVAEPAGAPARGPAVPTLVVSGAEDLRTPPASARRVAADYPGGRTFVVPDTGHSSVTTDPTLCAARAAFGFLGGATAPARCPRRAREFRIATRAPLRIGAVSGKTRRSRTVRAVRLTLRDLALAINSSTSGRFGGLRGGYVTLGLRPARAVLRGYEYIPGVKVSGRLRVSGKGRLLGTMRVSGRGAVTATVTLTASGGLKPRFAGSRASASALSVGAPIALPPKPLLPPPVQPLPNGISRWARQGR